jgi:hypothetical protein
VRIKIFLRKKFSLCRPRITSKTSRKKYLSALFLGALFSTSTIIAARADQGDQLTAMLDSMPVVSSDPTVQLKSDASLKNVAVLAKHFADAYNYDRRLLGLTASQLLNKRVCIGLATEQTINRYMKSSMGGRAFGNDSFVSHASLYSERPDFAWFVTAHELEHLQMHRLHANEPDVPVYIFEGIACSVGDRYVFSKFGNCNYLRSAKQRLADFSGADAADVVQTFRNSDSVARLKAQNKLWEGEHIGGLFIEFLQRRFPNDRFFPLFGLICQDMSNGIAFKAAFEKRLGVGLEDVEEQFIAYMTKTEDNPSARFDRTVYQDL